MVSFGPPGMTNEKLDEIIRRISRGHTGDIGLWQFQFADVTLVCITDENHDRMRVMSPISPAANISPEQLAECMAANFDRALDARYCLNDEMLWGAFIHPLSSLNEQFFINACHQVSEVVKNFGDTYASGGLSFVGPLLD